MSGRKGIGRERVLKQTPRGAQSSVGLDLMTLRSRPEPKLSWMLNQLRHPGTPKKTTADEVGPTRRATF